MPDPQKDHLHRAELSRPRRRERRAGTDGAGALQQVPDGPDRPRAPIVLPAVSHEVDYEAELVVVIGREGPAHPRERALEHVGGYTVGHDVSARDWQLNKPGKQWMAGKTFDTFAPVGPELVTPDEVPDPHNLGIRLRLNGQTMQDSNTSQLIFGVDELIAYLSQVFTLEPGDLIFTGTPAGRRHGPQAAGLAQAGRHRRGRDRSAGDAHEHRCCRNYSRLTLTQNIRYQLRVGMG